MVVAGATIVEKVLDKLPVLVYVGAAYLAFLAVTTAIEDPLVHHWVQEANAIVNKH
jgi:predicted tellurium resistance membrane protein TerC